MNKESLLYRFIKILYLKKIVKAFKSKIHVKNIKILLKKYINLNASELFYL